MSLLAPARRGRTTTFNSITDMLEAPSGLWTEALTLNSYGADKVRSTWIKVSKSSDSGSSMVANEDDLLGTADNLALAVRTGVLG